MKPSTITEIICSKLDGVSPKSTWGESSLFYNSDGRLPNGVYFCTIKEKDGENDKSSDLDRPNVYRLSIGAGKAAYEPRFGCRPSRPSKGCIVDTGNDFTALDVLMPHPIYAWMHWICINSPGEESFKTIFPLIQEAHALAIAKFLRKVEK